MHAVLMLKTTFLPTQLRIWPWIWKSCCWNVKTKFGARKRAAIWWRNHDRRSNCVGTVHECDGQTDCDGQIYDDYYKTAHRRAVTTSTIIKALSLSNIITTVHNNNKTDIPRQSIRVSAKFNHQSLSLYCQLLPFILMMCVDSMHKLL